VSSRRAYIIGSLANERVVEVGDALRAANHSVFDDWWAAGPQADFYWQEYEQGRGYTFGEALDRRAAQHVFSFDKQWLDWADTGVLVMPAGKSGHLELGYLIGRGCDGYILMEHEPEK